MAHYWGSFAEGLTRGFQQGWDLGEKINKAWDRAKYRSATEEVNNKYDSLEAEARATDAQVNALNRGKTEAQAETSKAYGGYTPTVEGGIREVAAINPETGKWQATVNDAPVAEQTANYKNEHTFVPFGASTENVKPESMREAVAAFEKGGDFAPKKEAAISRFSDMSLDDRLQQYHDERQQALSRIDRDYYASDPEKSRALRKEAEEEAFNQRLLGVYRGALNGDMDSLRILADSAAAQGLLPEGTQIVPNRDGTFALVTEDGHIYEDDTGSYGSVRLNRQMIEQAFQSYALTQRAYHDKDYKGLAKEQRDAREANRKDRELDVKESYLNSKAAMAQASSLAKSAGFKAGKWKPNAAGTGLVLYGTDANGNEDYPLAVANNDGTGIHPISMDAQWPSMVKEVESKGFKLGVNKNLEPIVISPDGQSAALYSGWADRTAEWMPIAGASPVQPEVSSEGKRGVRGLTRTAKWAGEAGPAMPEYAKSRAKAYPEEYDEEGMDKAYPKESSGGGADKALPEGTPGTSAEQAAVDGEVAPGAESVPEYDDQHSFMIPRGEEDWRNYARPTKAEPPAPHGYDPGMAPSMSAEPAKNLGDILQSEYNDRATDTSLTPPWLLRVQNADRARRGIEELPSMTERPKGKGTMELLEEVNNTRFNDHSQLSDHAKRMIDHSKGEPSKEHKEDVAMMNEAVKAEMRQRDIDPNKKPTLPDRSLFKWPEKSDEPKANPKAVRMGGKDEGVKPGPDIRSKQTPVSRKPEKAVNLGTSGKKASAPAAEEVKISAPVEGKIIHKKGDRVLIGKSYGQDAKKLKYKGNCYQVKEGDAVRAMASGTVQFSGWIRGAGNVVVISDSKGRNHVYKNTESQLKKGDRVTAGSTIGTAGYMFERDKGGNYVEYSIDKNPLRR